MQSPSVRRCISTPWTLGHSAAKCRHLENWCAARQFLIGNRQSEEPREARFRLDFRPFKQLSELGRVVPCRLEVVGRRRRCASP
jgi:predicted double-glycine peptidase